MATMPFLVATGMSLLVGAGYAYVACLVRKRHVSPEHRRAHVAFVVWWAAASATALIHTFTRGALYEVGVRSFPLHFALTLLASVSLTAAAWALLSFSLLLRWDRPRRATVLWTTYLLYLGAFVLALVWHAPTGVEAAGWEVRLVYARELPPIADGLLAISLLAPLIAGAIILLWTLVPLQDPTARFRLLLIFVGIVLWTLSLVVAFVIPDHAGPLLAAASPVTALLAATSVVFGYRPPRALRTRWKLRTLDEQPA